MNEIKLTDDEKEIAQWLTLEDIDAVKRHINGFEYNAISANFVYERLKVISTLNRYKDYLEANGEHSNPPQDNARSLAE